MNQITIHCAEIEREFGVLKKASCNSHAAHLADDHSHSTHSFLVSLIKSHSSYSSSSGARHHKRIYYIGATDHDLDFVWQWASSNKVVYPEMLPPVSANVHVPDQHDQYGTRQECLAINLNEKSWSKYFLIKRYITTNDGMKCSWFTVDKADMTLM
ncbi:unnamed protein product [Mytilus coruscus]|uniref:C-type lectin domain-containing protein n=1 Tax=Mytilus coruscus TaxID=42192 RepID=A0A6J7ZXA6_MYTCO|nr:unnamed protein product [Mytilus coruscus]